MKIIATLRSMKASPSLIVLARFVALSFGFVTAPIVARVIGVNGRGFASGISAGVTLVAIILDVGFSLYVISRPSAAMAASFTGRYRLWSGLMIIPAAAIGGAVCLLLGSGLDENSRVAVIFAFATAPLFIGVLCDQAVLIRQGKFGSVGALQLVQPATYLFLVLVLFFLGQLTLGNVLWSIGIGNLTAAFAGWRLVRKNASNHETTTETNIRDGIVQIISASGRLYASSLSEALSNRLDQFLVLAVFGATISGYYSVAALLGGLTLVLGHSFGAKLLSQNDTEESKDSISLAEGRLHGITVTIALAAVSISLVAAPAIIFLFGASFEAGIVPTIVYSVGGIFQTLSYVLSRLLLGPENQRTLVKGQLVGLAVGVFLLYPSGFYFGATGCAMAAGIGYLCTFIVFAKRLRFRWNNFLPTATAFKTGLSFLLKH